MEKKDHVLLGAALTVGAVEGWLDEHVDPETGYVVDDTLAIEGAAADAKATGEAIAAVEAEIPTVDATLATTGAAADAKATGDEIAELKSASKLLDEYIPGTTQTITFDAGGNVQSIAHSAGGAAVRTDVFTFGSDSITEVRTLSTGESLTIVTNTTTLATTITYAA